MRKVMLLAAMLAMVVVAAAPALAQATATGGDVQIQNQNCPQTITQYANATQSNTGGGTGAGVAQNLGIDQSAVNACLQAGNDINVGDGEEVIVEEFDPGVTHEVVHPVVEKKVDHAPVVHPAPSPAPAESAAAEAAPAEAAPAEAAPAEAAPSAETASATLSVLPDTGGASLLALGGGVLLVGSGLAARRIFR